MAVTWRFFVLNMLPLNGFSAFMFHSQKNTDEQDWCSPP